MNDDQKAYDCGTRAGIKTENARIRHAIQAMIKPGSKKLYCFTNWTYVKPEDVLRIVGGLTKKEKEVESSCYDAEIEKHCKNKKSLSRIYLPDLWQNAWRSFSIQARQS